MCASNTVCARAHIRLIHPCIHPYFLNLLSVYACMCGASWSGFVFCGKTGFGAGMAHSPQEDDTGKERYIFWVAPHVAYGPDDAPVG